MLVWSCIAPHGGELIPDLAGANLGRMSMTRWAMEELGRRCQRAAPDTVVVFTPHGTQVDGCITVGVGETASGTLRGEFGDSVSVSFAIDLNLAEQIATAICAAHVPAVPLAHADEQSQILPFELDWGALVPLWFMGAAWESPPRVVVLCPSRSLPRKDLVDAGRAIAAACAQSDSRIAVICSADQGHGHDESGPYGFASESAEYDEAYTSAVRNNSLESLIQWDEEWIGCAMTDSYWQTLMLHGALQRTPMRPDLLSYEAPTYFGMACAGFEPCES